MKAPQSVLKNKKGQGLIEYLIIVAIVAVGSIAVIKTVGANIDVKFATVAQALGGNANSTDQSSRGHRKYVQKTRLQ